MDGGRGILKVASESASVPSTASCECDKKYYKNDNMCLILVREANQKLSNIPLRSAQLRRWRAIAHQLIDSNLSFAIEKFVCNVGYLDCADSLKFMNDRLSLLFFFVCTNYKDGTTLIVMELSFLYLNNEMKNL